MSKWKMTRGMELQESGCPTWIRTRTKASKGPCATVTPSDNPPKISFVPLRRKENFLFATDLAAFEESFHPVVITEKLEDQLISKVFEDKTIF